MYIINYIQNWLDLYVQIHVQENILCGSGRLPHSVTYEGFWEETLISATGKAG